jgi:hypothetical protein
MRMEQEPFVSRYKWHITVIACIVIPVVYFGGLGDKPPDTGGSAMQSTLLYLGAAILLFAVIYMLMRISSIVDTLKENTAQLGEVAGALKGIITELTEISQSTRLSESAKAIAFRDTERASLQEAVYQKLNQNDFDAAYELIDEISQRHEYGDLADQLRTQANQQHGAMRNHSINQFIDQIDALLDDYQWSKASVQIESLIKAYPDSNRARDMRQKLFTNKEAHKKELMATWDEAVKSQKTDESLEILKELDVYLTPNEALALQEAAKDVYRNKLHNLGVQFSMAVSDRKWGDALEVGERIITDFPNSKMSEEIRGKLAVLKQNVQMH